MAKDELKIDPRELPNLVDTKIATDDDKIRAAEAAKKRSLAAADKFDMDDEELKKTIADQKVLREDQKVNMSTELEEAFRLLRQYQSVSIRDLMPGKPLVKARKTLTDQLEKIEEDVSKDPAKKALKEWEKALLVYTDKIIGKSPLIPMKIEYIRLIKEQKAKILDIRKKEIMAGINLEADS